MYLDMSAPLQITGSIAIAELLRQNKPKSPKLWTLSNDFFANVFCGTRPLNIAMKLTDNDFSDADMLERHLSTVFPVAQSQGKVIGNGHIFVFDSLLAGAKGTPDEGCPMYAVLAKNNYFKANKNRFQDDKYKPFYLQGVVSTSSYNLGFELNALPALPAPARPSSAIRIGRLLREVVTFNHRHILRNLSKRIPSLVASTQNCREVNERVYKLIEEAVQAAINGKKLLLNRAWGQQRQQYLMELGLGDDECYAVLDPVYRGRLRIPTVLSGSHVVEQLRGFTA